MPPLGNICGPVPPEAFERFRAQIAGRVVLPGEPDYDRARQLSDPLFQKFPCMIVYCRVEQDVALCLELVRQWRISFAVRSGGHSTAGYSANAGVLIDVSKLDAVDIDVREQSAWVGSGCALLKLGNCLDQKGLHLPLGDGDGVCVGGFMQGGGLGLTSRTYGMNCDNVLAIRMMLSSGDVVEASNEENADLWWAVRGGTGGNFGVLLRVKYSLVKLTQMINWYIAWPVDVHSDKRELICILQCLQSKYMLTGPSEINTSATVYWPNPDSNGSCPYLYLTGLYVGTMSDAKAAMAPLLAFPGSDSGFSQYKTLKETLPLLRPSRTLRNKADTLFYDRRSRFVTRNLSESEWHGVLDQFLSAPNHNTILELDCYGGAINAKPRGENAFPHRSSAFCVFAEAAWEEGGAATAERFLADWCSVFDPFWNGEIYQNFPSTEYSDYRWNYWGESFPALLAVKRKYDPDSLFQFPQAISAEGNKHPLWPPGVAASLPNEIRKR